MTSVIGNILAEWEFNLLGLLLFLAVGAIGAIAKWAEKKKEEQKEQQRLADLRRRRQEREVQGGQASPPRRQPQPPGQSSVADELRQAFGLQGQAPPKPPPPARQARPPRDQRKDLFPRPEGVEIVTESIAEAPPRPRRRRKAPPSPRRKPPVPAPEPTKATMTGVSSLGGLSSLASRAGRTSDPAERVNLSGPAEARRAILYHEILSPPKALRSDAEPWEL